MYSTKIEPKYNDKSNSRVGLITLATDFRIEKDFNEVIKNMDVDLFVNSCLLYTSPSPRDLSTSRMPSSA